MLAFWHNLPTAYSRLITAEHRSFPPTHICLILLLFIKYLPDNPALVSWPRKLNIWSPVDVRNGDCWQTDLSRFWEHNCSSLPLQHSLMHGICCQGHLSGSLSWLRPRLPKASLIMRNSIFPLIIIILVLQLPSTSGQVTACFILLLLQWATVSSSKCLSRWIS